MTETPPRRPSSQQHVQYRGDDLDPERGPGLGCFYLQMIVLGILLVLTPVSVSMGAPSVVSALLLFATLGILLVSGQTIIFLLRLVAAERREGRRRPLASGTRTVGEIEDVHLEPDGADATVEPDAAERSATTEATAPAEPTRPAVEPGASPAPEVEPAPAEPAPPASSGEGPVRQ